MLGDKKNTLSKYENDQLILKDKINLDAPIFHTQPDRPQDIDKVIPQKYIYLYFAQ